MCTRPEQQAMGEYAVIEVLEELYHASMASHAAYAVMKDTRYAAKSTRHSSVPYMAALGLHFIFLGRHLLCHVMPRKLLYLVDMLLHVFLLLSDAMLLVALLRCSPESLQLATGRMLWGGSCHVGSMIVAVVSIVYQAAALIIYYNRLGVANADERPGYTFACLFWLCEALRYSFQRLNSPPKMAPLREEFEVEHTLRTEEVCSASFELRYRPTATGFCTRCTARASASATLREDNRDY
ncbi:uncharacterized protein LOC119381943 [Rhipicephalus sanguineus]|uniref:uncharacterized protein LOC119381943 n=1 Tax=Rhipicephalus sanguineus TaxID=34632 RepID=UPI0020C3FA23|nr:uncharacterized protein LOC119381943 [Rhipicephalus sanguineus]